MNPGYVILVHIVWFLSTYFILVILLTIFFNRNKLYEFPESKDDRLPKVSVIVSAYNEQETISDCIESLKKVDYPKDSYEVIIINDGSTDKTSDIIRRYKHIRLIDNKKNKGKASCLNQGLAVATGEYMACMDADSIVSQDILRKTIPYFKDEKIGSVTVTVEVRFVNNFLQKIIQLEYHLGLSLFLKLLSLFNCIHVTPGPFSIYRKKLLDKIGYFDATNITEDLEIAYRIHKSGYKIVNCMATSVKTITPHNFRGLYRQRKRWYSGALLTLWQHKDLLMKNKAGLFGYFIPFNYTLITFGLALFVLSVYLALSNIVNGLALYSLTNYNFFSNLSFEFDILNYGLILFFGMSGILGMILLVTYGLTKLENGPKKRPSLYLGYFLLFMMYQIFWLVSFFLVLVRRRVKWH